MKWSRKNNNCIQCGTTKRKHRGLGLCDLCYKRKESGYKGIKNKGLWSYKHPTCRKCKQTTYPHTGRGLCKLCYGREWSNYKGIGHKPKTGEFVVCETCSKEYYLSLWRLKKRNKHRFCSQLCCRKFYRGKNHFWYTSGAGRRNKNYPEEFYLLSKQVRIRDGNKCQLCGVPQSECIRLLSVHHINYNKYDSRLSNLITLCNSCHQKTQTHREKWIDYFDIKRFITIGA